MARPTEEIKDRLGIVEFLKGYLDLSPAGKNFKAVCPFHQEKTPSFIVSPERQIWHCFGCGEGGDIFKFLMRYENLEFYEALQVLAEKAGVKLQNIGAQEQRQFGVLYDINNSAAEYFESELKKSDKAKTYFKDRGVKGETAKDFMLGYAPMETDGLTLELVSKGYSMADIVRAGLSLKTERGQYIDRFRGRVMFPIHNHFGKIIGFSGRILPEFDTDKMGKYINSPDTPIFNKSRVLYGFWQSKRYIGEEKSALLVEGQMDFLLAFQDGATNVVATSGTALTVEHLRALRRMTGKLILAFDSDEAGKAAAERAIDLAGGNDFSVTLLSLGKYEDPADAAVKSPGFIKKAMEKPQPAMEYYFERYLSKDVLGDIHKKKTAVRIVLMKIKRLWSPVERAHYINELSHIVKIGDRELNDEMEKLTIGEAPRQISPDDTSVNEEVRVSLTKQDIIAERILSLIAVKNSLYNDIASYEEFLSPRYKKIYVALKGDSKPDEETRKSVDIITLQSSVLFDGFSEDKLKEELFGLSKELALEHFRARCRDIGEEISNAERGGDDKVLGEKLKEFDSVLKKMQDIENAA